MRAPRADIALFVAGQALSRLGSSFTAFALPLLVLAQTGSAIDLGIATAAAIAPYPLFGLVLGAWVDRGDRRRTMIASDLARAAVISVIPAMHALGALSPGWIYAVAFATSTLSIVFDTCEFAAMPSLASGRALTALNGKVQSSGAAAAVLGPVLAGLLLGVVSAATVVLVDAATFVLSAWSLSRIRTRLRAPPRATTSVLRDVRDGLRYVLASPVLRNLSVMMALVNLVVVTTNAQLVLFARQRFDASGAEVSWLYAAESLGMAVCALLVAPLRRRLSFAVVALGTLAASGALIAAMALVGSYPVVLALWALAGGTAVMFNITTSSFRQATVPNEMLGRVISIASVLAWSTQPLGAVAGGVLLERTGDAALVYLIIGLVMIAIPLGFAFSPAFRSAGRPEA